MGNDILTGVTWIDGQYLTPSALNDTVNNATIKATAISARTAKTDVGYTEEFLINDAGTLKKTTKGEIFSPGHTLQTQVTWYNTNDDLTTVLPVDNTEPTTSEGDLILTKAFTPFYADSYIRVTFQAQASTSANLWAGAAVFRDAVCVACTAIYVYGGTSASMVIDTTDITGSVTPVTYTVRVGPHPAGTVRLNGSTTGGFFAGKSYATLFLEEIRV